MTFRVAVLEDQKDTREILAILINGSDGYKCIGTFENGEAAVAGIPDLEPDVMLVDIHLPGMTGIETVKKLKGMFPEMQFIMCTSLEDPENIFKALQAGATGYLVKSTSPGKILESITDAYLG